MSSTLDQKQAEMRERIAAKPLKKRPSHKKRREAKLHTMIRAEQLMYTPSNARFYRGWRMRKAENHYEFETPVLRCDICNEYFEEHRLRVDHDHMTNHIRGLLCNACNSGLGQFGDCINTINRAKRYLVCHEYGQPLTYKE